MLYCICALENAIGDVLVNQQGMKFFVTHQFVAYAGDDDDDDDNAVKPA
jgi:hypothetical protein